MTVQIDIVRTIPGDRNDVCNVLHEYSALQLKTALLASVIDFCVLSHPHCLVRFLSDTNLLAAQQYALKKINVVLKVSSVGDRCQQSYRSAYTSLSISPLTSPLMTENEP
jgi:hypothetical protein